MYIYKITNKINGKWYIGKHNGSDPNYMGSGKLLKQAYKKYGIENFDKTILETCINEEELNIKEIKWINLSGALLDPACYNLVHGGTGGDRSKFISYDNIDRSNYKMQGVRNWYNLLTTEKKTALHTKQGENRAKDWYVSRIGDTNETLIHNISKWCKEHGIGSSFVSESNTPGHPLFQKQSKGWRIRRADMPPLPPYENKRGKVIIDNGCKGRSWKLVNGKRVWFDK